LLIEEERQPTRRDDEANASSDYEVDGASDNSDSEDDQQAPPRTTSKRKRIPPQRFDTYQAKTQGIKRVTLDGKEYMTQSATKTEAESSNVQVVEEEEEADEEEEVEEGQFAAKSILDQQKQANNCLCKKTECVATRKCNTTACDFYDKVSRKPCKKNHTDLFYEVCWSGTDSNGKPHPNTWEHRTHLIGTPALREWIKEAQAGKQKAQRQNYLRKQQC
jgi:hypothetical protein